MPIPGNLLTTAMAVMPHTDPKRALEDGPDHGRAFLAAITQFRLP